MNIRPRFDESAADDAFEEWRCNCGPAALAVVADVDLFEVRRYMGDFERKGYTNPTLMFESARRARLDFRLLDPPDWPQFGLVRIQWEGPWTSPGVPMRVRYRHTHWVAAVRRKASVGIFDINCINSGGWVSLSDWLTLIVPHILKNCHPKANGGWHITHAMEVVRPCEYCRGTGKVITSDESGDEYLVACCCASGASVATPVELLSGLDSNAQVDVR